MNKKRIIKAMVCWVIVLLVGIALLPTSAVGGTPTAPRSIFSSKGTQYIQSFNTKGAIIGPYYFGKIHTDFISGSGWVWKDNGSRSLSFEFGPYGTGYVMLHYLSSWRNPFNASSDQPDWLGNRIGVGINYFFGKIQYKGDHTIIDGWCIVTVFWIDFLVIFPSLKLSPTEDSWVNARSPTQNYGTAESLEVAAANGSETARSYLKFNLSEIPSQSIINYALLQLNYYDYEGTSEPDIGAYRVDGGWDEGTITWENQPTVSPLSEYNNSLPPIEEPTSVRWDITHLGSGWIHGTIPNNGVALKFCTPSQENMAWRAFRSKEFPDETDRPVLLLSINVPPDTPKKPVGPASVRLGREYNYSTVTQDRNGDRVYYWFDWGDNTSSGWIGPYPGSESGGEYVPASHHWNAEGTYQVRAKAKDTWGLESSWSEPKNVTVSTI